MQELERVAIVESLEQVAEPQFVAQVLRPCRQNLRRQRGHGPQELFQLLCHPPAEHTSGSRWVGATFLDHHAARIAGSETPHQFVGQHGL